MCNYRHPGPRRVLEVGSEPQFLTPLPWLPWLRRLPWRVPKTQILLCFTVHQRRRGPKTGPLTQWGSMGPEAPQREPKDTPKERKKPKVGPKEPQRTPSGSQRVPQRRLRRPKSAPREPQGTPKQRKKTKVGPKGPQMGGRGRFYIKKLPINRPSGRYVI